MRRGKIIIIIKRRKRKLILKRVFPIPTGPRTVRQPQQNVLNAWIKAKNGEDKGRRGKEKRKEVI